LNGLLKIGIAVFLGCYTAAAVNYFLGLGWFGAYAQFVFALLMLLTLVAVLVAIRFWREP